MSVIGREQWNESARQYDAFEKKWNFYGTIAEAMLARIPLKEDSKVLELACGTGACTTRIAEIVRVGRVSALDSSDKMLDVARENIAAAGLTNVEFVHGAAGDIASLFAGKKFDFAVANSAFPHFPEPQRVLAGLRELLTEQGTFAFTMSARSAPSGESARPRSGLRKTLDESGFEVAEFPFEFETSLECRAERLRISAFSWTRHPRWWLSRLDEKTQLTARRVAVRFRSDKTPIDSTISRWRIFVVHPIAARSSP